MKSKIFNNYNKILMKESRLVVTISTIQNYMSIGFYIMDHDRTYHNLKNYWSKYDFSVFYIFSKYEN